MAKPQPYTTEQRRVKVAHLLKSRVPQHEIATQLGVSKATISRDAKTLRKVWQKSMSADIGDTMARELAELDHIEAQAAREYIARKPGNRSTQWLKVRLQCKEQRARLLGLEAAHEAATTARTAAAVALAMHGVTKDIDDLTPEQLEQKYKQAVLH